ncbi:MAG: tryptophan--tRNA ligase [Dokdonella sp.]|nr:tryptophan--tRNA ligase [Dokdonella sp.]MBZ0222376.1 tryptophan--tRNA ligase [Dokdonella sp.]MCC7255194.1 tryptophan--tRNA ligase [Dokdonella sp.]
MHKRRILTGITTSGTPHLGNYVGAVRPAIAASRREDAESFYFLADYHALIKCGDPARVQRSTLEIAATWLACGLDPDKVFFYRQSDIPEIPELTWLLTCVTAKGLLNRAHAYKAAVDANTAAGEDVDAGVSAGLYMYPVLMAADILIFNAHEVPVGRDQIQHIEMARDIGQRFNHLYAEEYFTLPEARIEENVATLPGTDGRKMSKSYNNTIPLFESPAKLRSAIMGIVTDSRAPGEAKDTEGSNLFALYQAFATPAETASMRAVFAEGIGWGEAKQKLYERIEIELAPLRERYDALMTRPERIEDLLQAGAAKARARTQPFIARLRHAAGIRRLVDASAATVTAKVGAGAALPQLKSYREADGKFHFKLSDGDGTVLLASRGFDAPKEAGMLSAALIEAGGDVEAVRALLLDCAPADELALPAEPIAAALAALKADRLAKAQAKAR